MDVNWFLGFLEGESTFCISFGSRRYTNKKKETYRNIHPRLIFAISLTEQDVLLQIKEFLEHQGVNAIVCEKPNKSSWINFKVKPKAPKQQWFLVVSSQDSVHKLIEILDNLEWYSEKRLAFSLWKESEKLVCERPCKIEQLVEVARIARSINSGKGASVWTPDFIKKNCVQLENGQVRILLTARK